MNAETFKDIGRGFVGILASGGGIGVSALPTVEAWLRILSLVVGILVGLVTIFSIVSRYYRDRK